MNENEPKATHEDLIRVNEAVARKLGYVNAGEGLGGWHSARAGLPCPLPNFSEDIKVAWEIVASLQTRDIHLALFDDPQAGAWVAELRNTPRLLRPKARLRSRQYVKLSLRYGRRSEALPEQGQNSKSQGASESIQNLFNSPANGLGFLSSQ